MPIHVGIVGLGKIALDEHVPALLANAAFKLVACASAQGALRGVEMFPGIAEMLDGRPDLDAVIICTPPQAHFAAATMALARNKHVLLEKPPCPTVAEFDELTALARRNGVSLFQSWHARESAAVEQARQWLAHRPVRSGRVVWKEDVRHWHPGQHWIWQEGGFGVLDAAINGVSILTRIVPDGVGIESAHLLVPENCAMPIAAFVTFRTGSGATIDAEFDFRNRDDQTHAIALQTDDGALTLAWPGSGAGGDVQLEIGNQREEYTALYRRFAHLIARGACDTDKRPLELVEQILQTARRSRVAAFTQ